MNADAEKTIIVCPECGASIRPDRSWGDTGTMTTMVGYSSPAGHNHDDNCRIRLYECANGHKLQISKQNKCHACAWEGKTTCFCHSGTKVKRWPDEDTENDPQKTPS